jgi:hypothetical protein
VVRNSCHIVKLLQFSSQAGVNVYKKCQKQKTLYQLRTGHHFYQGTTTGRSRDAREGCSNSPSRAFQTRATTARRLARECRRRSTSWQPIFDKLAGRSPRGNDLEPSSASCAAVLGPGKTETFSHHFGGLFFSCQLQSLL